MKSLKLVGVLFFWMLYAHNILAQDAGKNWDFTVSFGPAYHTMHPEGSIFKSIESRKFQKALGLNLEYHLSDSRYIGLGYTRHEGSYNVDGQFITGIYPVGVVLDNYRHTWATDYFELNYRKTFENRLELSVGLFYFLDYTNQYGITDRYEPHILFMFGREKPRTDNLGLSLALGYALPVNDYLQIGLRSKLYYTLSGFETVSLSPFVRFSF